MISDFRVMGDQREVFGLVASVPTAWRALREAAAGGDRARRRITAAVNRARLPARAQAGPLPPVRIADRQLKGVACIRLDAAVVQAHSGKELAEANFKGYEHHPLLAACDNTGADHLRLLREAVEVLPPTLRRRIMVTCDGAGASHELVKELDRLASRHGCQVTWSVGWALGARDQAVLGKVPASAWEAAIDAKGKVRERRADGACQNPRCAHLACWIGEAHVAELTGLLREGPGGDQLKG